MAAEMITPGQRLPCALVPSAADLKVRTPKTEIPRQSYQAVALETRDSDRLLHPRRERPRDSCAAEQRDERAALHHSINSSARPDRGSGTVMPSALAVLRFRNISTFVDCWTGSSPGFSPLRIRAA